MVFGGRGTEVSATFRRGGMGGGGGGGTEGVPGVETSSPISMAAINKSGWDGGGTAASPSFSVIKE